MLRSNKKKSKIKTQINFLKCFKTSAGHHLQNARFACLVVTDEILLYTRKITHSKETDQPDQSVKTCHAVFCCCC